jgi:hypothetical protein
MPELPVKEVRMPELHLPEIDRAEITRSLSEMHLPEFDLPRIERPKMPDRMSKMPDRMSKVDLGKAVAGVVAMTPFRPKPAPRRRWPLAVGLIIAGVATAAVLSNRSLRDRLAAAVNALRTRLMAMRQGTDEGLEIDIDEPVAFQAAETAPIDPMPYADGATAEVTGYPDGLGADAHTNGAPTLEETGVRD